VTYLQKKILTLYVQGSSHYVGFLDNLIRNSCVGFDPEDLRKISGTLTSLAQEKQRALKASKCKKKTKGTLGSVGKASKRVELSAFGDYDDDVGVDDTNDDFDFM
jgi:translation initiation factor 3 subunit J